MFISDNHTQIQTISVSIHVDLSGIIASVCMYFSCEVCWFIYKAAYTGLLPVRHYTGKVWCITLCVFIPAECLFISAPSVGQSCSLTSDFVHRVGRSFPVLVMNLDL